MDTQQRCMGCMQSKEDDSEACAHCGYRPSPRSPVVLPYQAVLNNKFLVGRILGKPGGFGVTYLAWDLVLHTTVAIKEYFPRNLASRSPDHSTVVLHVDKDNVQFEHGLEQFLREARTLAQFSHPNIVRVREFFQQNNTAYLVMDYYEGVSLEEFVQRKGGRISEHLALNIFLPILDGLRAVHEKKVLHRDIKPANIYLTKGDTPILLDFGAARFALGQNTQTLSVILTAGFAPFEQYLDNAGDALGAWTDIYACGATLYAIITGIVPQNAINRHQKDDLRSPIHIVPTLTPQFSRAIMAALTLDYEQRPQTVAAFQQLLLSNEPIYTSNANATAPFAPLEPDIFTTQDATTLMPDAKKTKTRQKTTAAQKHLPIIDADAKLNFLRCPHCGHRNTVPFGQAYSTVKCQDCGEYLSNKPERSKASTLNKSKLAVQLVLFVIIAVFAKYAIDNTHFVSKTAVAVSELTEEPQAPPIAENDELLEAEKNNEHEPPPPAPRKEEPEPPKDPPEPLAPSEEADPPAEPPPPEDLGTRARHSPPPLINGEPPAPPRMAITACQGKRSGMSCLSGHGTCYPIRGELACIPLDHPPPPH